MATFEELLREHNVPCQTSGRYTRQGWVQFACPFCFGGKDPDKPYAGYNVFGKYMNCWRCGKHSLTSTLAALTGLPLARCQALLKDLEAPEAGVRVERRGKLHFPRGLDDVMNKRHRRYLRQRGYDPDELIKLWNLSSLSIAGSLSWRVFIPIIYQGETVSWTTRAVSDDVLTRYLSAKPEQEAINHKDLLYGEDYARSTILVVEGPTDVWRLGPGAVATLGTSVSQAQILKMAKYPVRVICFDSERAAQSRASALCDTLEVFDGETYNVKLNSKDPGVATDREVEKLRRRFLSQGFLSQGLL